eukprot:CAMPEP_0194286152 /NCGR_PEP_ID=MMETSP0169-20130528/31959_1 /TAXON_ID=218684 /ORGANISM="Corethron pennatum, Strain L29A3" /LENGTH=296 /DNA_ID=CAMNT_0039032499 /DNA_START=145 /DNA_END=1032 /DNA_ORIENTATION=+
MTINDQRKFPLKEVRFSDDFIDSFQYKSEITKKLSLQLEGLREEFDLVCDVIKNISEDEIIKRIFSSEKQTFEMAQYSTKSERILREFIDMCESHKAQSCRTTQSWTFATEPLDDDDDENSIDAFRRGCDTVQSHAQAHAIDPGATDRDDDISILTNPNFSLIRPPLDNTRSPDSEPRWDDTGWEIGAGRRAVGLAPDVSRESLGNRGAGCDDDGRPERAAVATAAGSRNDPAAAAIPEFSLPTTLPSFIFGMGDHNVYPDVLCSVCFQDFGTGAEVVVSKKGLSYHRKCADSWNE